MIVKLKERIGIGGCGHTDPAEKLVMARQRFKENQECVDIVLRRLQIHCRLVKALRNDGKIQESMEQFKKLLAEWRQSLGPDHPDPETIRYEIVATHYQTDPATEVADALRDDRDTQENVEDFEKVIAEASHSLGPNHPEILCYENCAKYYHQMMLQFETPKASNSSAAVAPTSQKRIHGP